jgi:hypothetical protein
LGHTVDWFDDLATKDVAVLVLLFVARRGGAVDYLAFFELALEVSGNEIPSAEVEGVASGEAG